MKLREYSTGIPERFRYNGCPRSFKIWCCCGGRRASRKGCPAPYDVCFLPMVTTQLWRSQEHQKLEEVGKNTTHHGLKPGIPVNIFPYPNMIQMSNFTNDMGKFPIIPHQLQLQRTIGWTKSNPNGCFSTS